MSKLYYNGFGHSFEWRASAEDKIKLSLLFLFMLASVLIFAFLFLLGTKCIGYDLVSFFKTEKIYSIDKGYLELDGQKYKLNGEVTLKPKASKAPAKCCLKPKTTY